MGGSEEIEDSKGNKNKDIYTIKLIQPRPNLPLKCQKDLNDKL